MAITPLDVAIRTHVGLVRSSNQDWLHADADLGILVLADGMGGHRGGEVASQLAIETAWEIIRDLVNHLPLMLTPRWVRSKALSALGLEIMRR